MLCVNRFKSVKSLTLINVGISVIEGLQEASRLEELWLNENTIGRIEGLDKCTSLRSLYISHNLIKRIEGLDMLAKLETLWLCDNKIEVHFTMLFRSLKTSTGSFL
jgi:Leucine-rich repeat (LRR) protein